MAFRDRAFIAVYFGSYKLPIAASVVLKGADIAIRSAVTGFWLGLLTPHRVQRLDAWYYSRGFPMYLDPAYNRSGWFDWEKPVVEKYFTGLSRVMIAAGAGAGREMLALNRMGVRTVGYEYNPELRALGNRLLTEDGWEPTLMPAEAGMLAADTNEYDGVIIGWGTYSLMPGRHKRIAFLKTVRERCRQGAPMLISFLDRTGDGAFFRASTKVANVIRKSLRRPQVEFGDTLSVSFAHRFTHAELAEEALAAGFRPIDSALLPYAYTVLVAE